jgi:peptidyl-prolyl cis-trans isomerase SurA
VDNVPLTLSEYQVRHRQEVVDSGRLEPFDGVVNQALLERMITERIQVRQAERRGIQVSEQEIDAAIEFIARQNGITSAALIGRLDNDGFSLLDFRKSIRDQQMIRKLVDSVANSRVRVSDQEIDNYLNAHSELRAGDETYEVSHLIVVTRDKTAGQVASERENMDLIRQRILDGLAFEQAVRDYSDGASGDDGGYLGWRTPDQLPELFLNALRDMDPEGDNISAVLESSNGLHLLKLHDRKGSGSMVDQQLIEHILVAPDEQTTLAEAERLADRIHDQLLAGEPFDKMARLHSDDAQSRTRGGSLGWVNPGTLVPAFEDAARGLTIGDISRPVKTRFGFHIIRVMDRRSTDMANEVAVNQARQAIFRRKAEEIYSGWLQSQRERTFVEYVGVPEAEKN